MTLYRVTGTRSSLEAVSVRVEAKGVEEALEKAHELLEEAWEFDYEISSDTIPSRAVVDTDKEKY